MKVILHNLQSAYCIHWYIDYPQHSNFFLHRPLTLKLKQNTDLVSKKIVADIFLPKRKTHFHLTRDIFPSWEVKHQIQGTDSSSSKKMENILHAWWQHSELNYSIKTAWFLKALRNTIYWLFKWKLPCCVFIGFCINAIRSNYSEYQNSKKLF